MVSAFVGVIVAASALAADVDAWVRPGCPRCAEAERFLDELAAERPGLEVAYHDVAASPAARTELERLSTEHGVEVPGVPSFLVGDELVVGFVDATTTGARLVALLDGREPASDQGAGELCEVAEPCADAVADGAPTRVDVPLLGPLDPARLGLPLFTLALGLVDGLNPCATWVLLFLLSVLVRMEDRAAILVVAGTFVLMSGLVYYAFMAAWLSVFSLLGLSRAVQAVLGAIALGIGAVNLRDALSRRGGFTLAIPDRWKPVIMERSRAVSRAGSLGAAAAGAAALALLVNAVELLCTAGLPAVYTHVLARHPLSRGAHYAYLALYDLGYIFDDAVLVSIAVATLRRTRLQQRGGRLLKAAAGLVMAALGGVLLLRPEWLAFG